jgi:hypothetical protein
MYVHSIYCRHPLRTQALLGDIDLPAAAASLQDALPHLTASLQAVTAGGATAPAAHSVLPSLHAEQLQVGLLLFPIVFVDNGGLEMVNCIRQRITCSTHQP